MLVNIYFKNMRSSEKLKSSLENKLQKYDKFLDSETKVSATFKMVKAGVTLDLVIYFNKNLIKAEETGTDGSNAIDLVLDKIDLQLKKYKAKLQLKGTESIRYDACNQTIDTESEEEKQIVKVKHFALKPMSPSEASLQMELVGHNFFVFLNDETEDVNVIYRRKDGNYGLIEPEL
ncbi:MAG: ribosome-associated translation inhibitor RaiA [Eubacteriaceae bacterium]|nr:ribosome-associated translation inhibitor RaiA [Eubacteriaceae bacterium]